ncbi:MAG: hypothetical protein U9R79_05730 [Armatimonadota bacterium]|nr:hypothetical protein [Armatimonadota bacterium]
MLRVLLVGVLLTATVAGAQDYQAVPYGDLEYLGGASDGTAAWPVWARAGGPCSARGWTVIRGNPAGGEVCVRGTVAGEKFTIAGEGYGSPITGSVALRSDIDGAQATIRLSWFNRLSRVDEKRTVDLSPEWQRFELSTSPDSGGPFELAVAPAGEAAVYADEFSIRCAGPPLNERVEDATPVAHPALDLDALQQYEGGAAGRAGSVPLMLRVPEGDGDLTPVASGGIPFPKGELYDRRHVRVTTADGEPVEAQLDVLSRWHGDSSILALLVTVPTDAPRELRLEYSPEITGEQQPRGMEPPSALPVVVGLDGSEYGPEDAEWAAVERGGPLMAVTARRRAVGPLQVEVRTTVFRGSSKALVSATFINEGERVALKGLGLRLKRTGAAPLLLMSGDGYVPTRAAEEVAWGIGPARAQPAVYGLAAGAEPTGSVAVPSGDAGIGVSVRDFAENRPSGFTVTQEALTAWAWPPEAGGFVMSQGMARTFDVLIDLEADGPPPPYRTQDLPLLTAPAQWYCDSGVFNFLMPPDAETFPIFESTLGSLETLGRFSWERKESGDLYGWFNFGDAPGDGGWSNLETMADHELLLHFFRTLSREHFDNARLAAEHYRDVDIDHRFGYCHTHCNNHTSSGESWSHSWIQGIRDLYLLTGNTRSLAVLGEVGERLLSKDPGFTTGRDWTRAIDNLVDISQVTGDRRYLDAAMDHIRLLGERQEPETGVCGAEKGSWYENRYAAGSAFTWYGCLAMAKLHQNVGGDELREIFLRELDLSLDVETKGKAAWVYPQDAQISEDKGAQVIGQYTLGRGSVLFPALGYAYRITGDEQYLRRGMDVLAYCLLNQRGGSDASATSFITAFLREAKAAGYGPEQEREAFERARDFSWSQHPRELTNGGFEMPQFAHWSVKKVPGRDFYEDPIVHVGYYWDDEVTIEGQHSLRIHSDNRLRRITVTGRTALTGPRRWRLTGWVRSEGSMNPQIYYSLRSFEDDSGGSGMLTDTGETREGWVQRSAEFMTMGRQVLTISLINRQGTGDCWFDGLELEDLGETGKLLTENGVGHEGREPSEAIVIRTGGSYLPDAPMTGDVEMEGPIPFTEGALTDGDDSYDYHRTPCSYAYWEDRERGEVLFDLQDTYRIDRVSLKVNSDPSRRAHGTARIELLPAEGEEPIAVMEPVDGWNSFEDLGVRAQKLRLRLHLMEGRAYLTIAEVQIWGDEID